MKPADYNPPNEPEQFDTIHAFVCASVAACFTTIYPRANPEKFRELVARVVRPETPACTEEGYCTRNGCDCPCCEAAHAKLRAISTETSPRPCQCETCAYFAAKTGRCDAASSEVTVVYSDHYTKESLGAAVRQAIQTNSSGGGQSSHPDS